jgi:hypothetical protein
MQTPVDFTMWDQVVNSAAVDGSILTYFYGRIIFMVIGSVFPVDKLQGLEMQEPQM